MASHNPDPQLDALFHLSSLESLDLKSIAETLNVHEIPLNNRQKLLRVLPTTELYDRLILFAMLSQDNRTDCLLSCDTLPPNPFLKAATSIVWPSPPIPPPLSTTSLLAKLPLEIYQMILSNFPPPTFSSLRKTCRHFYHTITIAEIPPLESSRLLRLAEVDPHHHTSHACFSCYQLKPAEAFMSNLLYHHLLRKGGNYAHHCRCIPCCIRHHTIQYGDVIHEGALPEVGPVLRVFCYGCRRLQRDFCWNCRLCRGCVRVERCRRKEGWGHDGLVVRVEHEFNSREVEARKHGEKGGEAGGCSLHDGTSYDHECLFRWGR